MGRKQLMCYLWGFLVLGISDFARSEADPAILNNGDIANLPSFQTRLNADARSRLSTVQQQQILSDVQQHQFVSYNPSQRPQLVTFPGQSQKSDLLTTSYPSLAKYRVDRNKQQQERPFLQAAPSQYQFPTRQNYQTNPINFNIQSDLPHLTFQNQPELNYFNEHQLQTYFEKQRELESLRKQREQLILEQQELRRQQELLRIQHLRQLTSTSEPITTTTIPTTQAPVILSSPSSRKITPAESELFLKAIATHQKKYTTTTDKSASTKIPITTTEKPRQERTQQDDSQEIPKDLLSLIQAQNPQLLGNGKNKPQIKIIYQTEKPPTSKPATKSKNLEKDQLLKSLKLALAENSDDTERNVTTRDLVLPNGRKLQIIQAPNGLSSIVPNEGSSQFQTVTQALDTSPSATSTTTVRPAKAVLDELTKGVLPPGTDFEVLRHQDDGKLEDVGKSPNQLNKKVTFVVLEEQSDGSYKVQGVKGNTEKDNPVDVESIVEKIKKGEIKLPPSSKSPSRESMKTVLKTSNIATTTTTTTTTIRPTTTKYTGVPSTSKYRNSQSSADYSPFISVTPNSVSQTDNYVTSASTPSANIYNSISSFGSTTPRISTTSYRAISSTILPPKNHFIPTMPPVSEIISSTTQPPTFSTTYSPQSSSSYVHFSPNPAIPLSSPSPRVISSTIASIYNHAASENLILDDVNGRNTESPFDNSVGQYPPDTMANLLRREGLFAMAKYLRQSGLDTVLNETGPYTIFVPTDKAFRTLLVQLGGPEKAEQKFKENPRLLSGLLLHHVIPGAFRIDSLQDEMTGVSLAGTQLRVNVYDMHDHEWNDVKVTTINGAKVAPNKRDIELPQGIAHAVDRVMFPLPVGDLTQTLAADREQRFGTFLRLLHASGLEDTLAGSKTFTVFAPLDSAFAAAATQNGRPVWTESDGQETAKAIISRHIMPTTMYTAGMRYYHQKDTLRPQFTLKIQKNGGRVRVNEAQVITHNIPATNGVIHAIDAIL